MGEELMQLYNTMPLAAQQELYNFARFLVFKSSPDYILKLQKTEQPVSCKREAGIGKDPDFYMAPDFDEPLEDFAEYM